ncbi:hypothetical protein OIU74_013212, partial [Salix koriyanagi]
WRRNTSREGILSDLFKGGGCRSHVSNRQSQSRERFCQGCLSHSKITGS